MSKRKPLWIKALLVILFIAILAGIYSELSSNGPVSFNLKTCSKNGEEIHRIISIDPDVFDSKKCCPGLWPYFFLSGQTQCKPLFYQYPYGADRI